MGAGQAKLAAHDNGAAMARQAKGSKYEPAQGSDAERLLTAYSCPGFANKFNCFENGFRRSLPIVYNTMNMIPSSCTQIQ